MDVGLPENSVGLGQADSGAWWVTGERRFLHHSSLGIFQTLLRVEQIH